jgi:hypothetical protein
MNKEDKSKLQLIGEIAEANNKNLELIEEINKLYEVLDKIKEYCIKEKVLPLGEQVDYILELLEEIE